MSNMKEIQQRLTRARAELLVNYPFFGTLLMRVKFGMANCGTAFTNMEYIVVDPAFVNRLSDLELQFILLHEIMHIILNHCARGKGLDAQVYNVACDIVVNSNILKMFGMAAFYVDGEEVMHLAPDEREGYLYDVETVYKMLIDTAKEKMQKNQKLVDSHDAWDDITDSSFLEEEWKEEVKNQMKGMGSNCQLPPSVRKIEEKMEYRSKLDWRWLLRDFIQKQCEQYDYFFTRPDRRFSDADFILPSFCKVEELIVKNIWFCVDTSASVDGELLQIAFNEIKSAILQCKNLSGKLSFFDTRVTTPQDFEGIESLEKCEPQGGGGTSFHAIFKYMHQYMRDKLPKAIIILTDGYAEFPNEGVRLGVPVMWVMVRSERKAPWGKNVVV